MQWYWFRFWCMMKMMLYDDAMKKIQCETSPSFVVNVVVLRFCTSLLLLCALSSLLLSYSEVVDCLLSTTCPPCPIPVPDSKYWFTWSEVIILCSNCPFPFPSPAAAILIMLFPLSATAAVLPLSVLVRCSTRLVSFMLADDDEGCADTGLCFIVSVLA